MSTPLDIDAVVLINEALTGNRCSEERKQLSRRMSVQLFLLRHRQRADNKHRRQPSQRSFLSGRQQKDGAGDLLGSVPKQLEQVLVGSRPLRRCFNRHRCQPARHH